jgi:hypothetical protein
VRSVDAWRPFLIGSEDLFVATSRWGIADASDLFSKMWLVDYRISKIALAQNADHLPYAPEIC